MMTGYEYLQSLNDNRKTYFEGERVDIIEQHPVLSVAARSVAECYDDFYDSGEGARSPLMKIPRSVSDLKAHIPILHRADLVAHVTYQSIMTLITAAGRILDRPEYVRS